MFIAPGIYQHSRRVAAIGNERRMNGRERAMAFAAKKLNTKTRDKGLWFHRRVTPPRRSRICDAERRHIAAFSAQSCASASRRSHKLTKY
jgi:hypothetical protein